MPWTYQDYPASMKNLATPTRHKAIDIANALLDEGYDEGRAIPIATAQAEKWAQRRDKPVKKEGAEGETGKALESDPVDDEHPIHVIPDPQGSGWLATQKQQAFAQGKDTNKDYVMDKARQKAKEHHLELYIHNEQGKITEQEEY
jgi:hypothetical protein